MNIWILITILLGLIAVIVGVIVLYVMQKKKKEGVYKDPDYRAFFIMGICFLPMGIIFTTTVNIGFMGITALGIIYMVIGLSNRDKWEKREE